MQPSYFFGQRQSRSEFLLSDKVSKRKERGTENWESRRIFAIQGIIYIKLDIIYNIFIDCLNSAQMKSSWTYNRLQATKLKSKSVVRDVSFEN